MAIYLDDVSLRACQCWKANQVRRSGMEVNSHVSKIRSFHQLQ
jgi:hypothetical protein